MGHINVLFNQSAACEMEPTLVSNSALASGLVDDTDHQQQKVQHSHLLVLWGKHSYFIN
jgi:hypothetical protein